MGQHPSDGPRDLATLTFDLGGPSWRLGHNKTDKVRITCDGALIGSDWTTVDVRFTADHYDALMIERRQLATYTHKQQSYMDT